MKRSKKSGKEAQLLLRRRRNRPTDSTGRRYARSAGSAGRDAKAAGKHTHAKGHNNKSAKKRGKVGPPPRSSREERNGPPNKEASLSEQEKTHPWRPRLQKRAKSTFLLAYPSPHAQHNRTESSVWDNVIRTSATSQTVQRRALFFFLPFIFSLYVFVHCY